LQEAKLINDLIARIYGSTHDPQAAPVAAVPAAPAPTTPNDPLPPVVVTPQVQMPPPDRSPSILGAISGLFAPEAGSFWGSAMKHGLAGAKQGLQDDANARAKEDAALRALIKKERYQVTPTGSVLDMSGDKPVEVYRPSKDPGETERLLERWRSPDTSEEEKEIIRAAIRGYQYTPEYIAADTQRKIRVKGATPGKAPSTGRAGGRTRASTSAPQPKPPAELD
jgi:hypothetical protein